MVISRTCWNTTGHLTCAELYDSSRNSLSAEYVSLSCWTTTAMALFQGVGRATFQILKVSLDVQYVVCGCYVLSRKLCPLACSQATPRFLSSSSTQLWDKIWLGTRVIVVYKSVVQNCRCPVFVFVTIDVVTICWGPMKQVLYGRLEFIVRGHSPRRRVDYCNLNGYHAISIGTYSSDLGLKLEVTREWS